MNQTDTSTQATVNDPTYSPLLQNLKDGKTSAWNQCVLQYDSLIQGWLLGFGATMQDIDDLKQEIYAFVFRRLCGFHHNGRTGAFRTWLKRITYNRLREFRRKKNNLMAQLPDNVEFSAGSPEINELMLKSHLANVQQQILEILTRKFHGKSIKVFCETVLNERSIGEVSDELGMSQGAVRVAKSRVYKAYLEICDSLLEKNNV